MSETGRKGSPVLGVSAGGQVQSSSPSLSSLTNHVLLWSDFPICREKKGFKYFDFASGVQFIAYDVFLQQYQGPYTYVAAKNVGWQPVQLILP